jgi:hypothetical protein
MLEKPCYKHCMKNTSRAKIDITAISLFTKTVLQEIQQNSYLQLISGPQSDLSTPALNHVVCLHVDLVNSLLTYVTYGT